MSLYCWGKKVYVTPKLIANLLGLKLRGLKMRVVGNKEYVEIPLDYEVPYDYKAGELTTSMFSKKGNQAHELVTKVLLPKTTSTRS